MDKNKKKKNKYKVLDLFCGAGGLSRGFLDAGFDVVLGIDYDDSALKTFKMNHGNSSVMKLDLFNHKNIDKIVEFVNSNSIKLDVLIGGPPCQGFSLAGPRDKNDKRNFLYQAMLKVAERLKPKVILLENVPGMLLTNGGIGAKRIINDFTKIGYNMNVKILYAPDYGVPQIRKRAFFVGIFDSATKFEYPEPVLNENEYLTCKDAISDLPSLEKDNNFDPNYVREYTIAPKTEYQKNMRKNSNKLFNHTPTKHTPKTIKYLSMVPDGGKYTDLPKNVKNGYKYHESLHRYNSKKPSLTIDTGHRTHFHYKYNRIPTVRENARLQSFPDDFIFYGNKQEQYKQVGNAVPPLLGKAIASKIKEQMDNGEI